MNSYSVAERINSDVNASVQYKTDLEQYSKPEFWQEAGVFGDCEDYALRKRELLLESGFARKDLHLACCWCETDKGNYILDNRYEWPMLPKSLPYKWESILCDGKWRELQGFA